MKIDINILASSDIHGYYMPWDYSMDKEYKLGSLAQISTVVNEQRQKYKNTILIDVGDMFQGNCSEIFADDDIHPAVIAMNHMSYDIWEMGNHEYSYGIENLQRFINHFNGLAIGANVYKDGKRLHKPYAIIEKDGIKIAFIGLVTSLINKFEKGTRAMGNSKANDMKKELELLKIELKDKVDYIVGIFHCGIENENNFENTGVRDILKGDDSLIAVFCGHFHEVQNLKINDTIVLQSGKFGQAISKLVLEFEKDEKDVRLIKKNAEIIYIDEKTKPDNILVEKLSDFHKKAIAYSNEEIGLLDSYSMSSNNEIKGIPQMRIEETAITDFFLDVVRYYGKADVSMIQLDNDDAGLEYGKIRRKDINRNYTYVSGGITSYEISGKTLKKIVDYASYFYNESKAGDINISFNLERLKFKYSTNYFFGNLKYDIDLTDYKRIKNLSYSNGNIIGDDDKIIFATTKYTMDILRYNVIKDDVVNKIYSTKDDLRESGSIRNLSHTYIKQVLNGVVNIKARNNWKIITAPIDEKIRKIAIKLINMNYISLIYSEDGKFKNTDSINIYNPVDKYDKNLEKLGIDIYSYKTKGELYWKVSEILNLR